MSDPGSAPEQRRSQPLLEVAQLGGVRRGAIHISFRRWRQARTPAGGTTISAMVYSFVCPDVSIATLPTGP